MAFGLEKPVFRILVNTMGTLGAIGLTAGVMPSLTLGSGGVGGAITGDNITAAHLININALRMRPRLLRRRRFCLASQLWARARGDREPGPHDGECDPRKQSLG